MRDLFDFLNEDPAERLEYRFRFVETLHDRDGVRVVTTDLRGFCPGSCQCIECAHRRVRINRANRVAASFSEKRGGA